MVVANRRAPRKARVYRAAKPFRYMQRRYDKGDTFPVASLMVPRHRIDQLWRDGAIETLDGERCPAAVEREVEAEPPKPKSTFTRKKTTTRSTKPVKDDDSVDDKSEDEE